MQVHTISMVFIKGSLVIVVSSTGVSQNIGRQVQHRAIHEQNQNKIQNYVKCNTPQVNPRSGLKDMEA